jgi:leader peptidase (prepilin peptidase)/N-methyltransferase
MPHPFLFVWLGFAFLLGASVGSWLNVCIYRIPYEKSLLWPGSRCGTCFQPVRWYDNIPLLSYWILRGRCRTCGATFSARYFLIELFTGLVFAGLFWLEIVENVEQIPLFGPKQAGPDIRLGLPPIRAWLFWGGHATLVSFLIVTTFTDFDHMEIPLCVTVTGTLFGLALSACFPWPWPGSMKDIASVVPRADPVDVIPVLGWQPWPLWRPDQLPSWLAPGSWQLGLATGFAGVLAGMLALRGVRFLFGVGRGIEGLGLGDADLMMMAGAFIGWQPILIAFFVSVFPALVLGIGYMIVRRDQQLPFGPSLALGILLTLFGWRWIGPRFQPIFFDRTLLIVGAVSGAFFLLVTSFMLRLIRGTPAQEEA